MPSPNDCDSPLYFSWETREMPYEYPTYYNKRHALHTRILKSFSRKMIRFIINPKSTTRKMVY